jgi:hypothetical protein
MKKIILLTLLTIVGIMGISQVALADNPTLSISPATANSTVGTSFNVSVQVNPAGSKVCVVKGTINLDNLNCQSITVASGLTTAVAPTCASPSFSIGIPKCTTLAQSILSISVAGSQVGQASLSTTGAKVAGVGVYLTFNSQGGTYNITTAKTTTPKTTTPTTTIKPTTTITTEPTTTTTVTTPTPTEQTTPNTTIPANAGTAALANSGASQWFNWILIIVVILIVIYAVYYFATKRKKK